MRLLLKNATLVTQNAHREILHGDIFIEDNLIREIGPGLQVPDAETWDLTNHVILPGLIQTHVHLCQALFRNLADDLELLDWLSQYIWPLESAHTESSLRASARLGLTEMLKSGVTAILDMGSASHMDVVFEEMVRSGIRGYSGKVMMDHGTQPYKEPFDDIIRDTERLIHQWHNSADGRVGYALAPRFVLTCSDQLWEAVRDLSHRYNLIIHTHAAENKSEVALVQEQTGYRNVEFFVRKHLASPKLCLAHCIWLSDQEVEYLKDYHINVMHCPSANLKLGSGFAPIPRYLEEGINVSLGSDGAPCNNNLDIFIDLRLAALIHKPTFGVTTMNAQQVLDMVTINGAKTLGLEDKIGSLEAGKLADLTILQLNKVHHTPADNVISQIVYSAQSRDVVHVMVDGKWVVQYGRTVAYDEEEVVRTAREACAALLEVL
ncbi:MAG: 5'-deoxyadenosine deaminase [Calditrichaeota bacterium]|nr:MAG: 5'-deoxyadenosine deaminase [Calditrichota bacterium]